MTTTRTILVTGAAGFIGSNFVRMLMSRGARGLKLVALDKLTYAGNLANLEGLLDDKERLVFVKGDICDAKLVEQLWDDQKIRGVVHFAAESHVDRSILGSGPFVQAWPTDEHRLSLEQRMELQQHLIARGILEGEPDGVIGRGTLEAVKNYQRSNGLQVDGFPTLTLLKRLRSEAPPAIVPADGTGSIPETGSVPEKVN